MILFMGIAPALAVVNYTVRPGDSLSTIAESYSLPLNTLLKYNNISNPDRISVGQVLRIPDQDDLAAAEEAEKQTTDTQAAATPNPDTAQPPLRQLTRRELEEARTKWVQEQQKQQPGSNLVQAAQRFAGTPYRWGGLTSRGMDCSGLVVRAMLAQGKRVPHNAASLYRMGQPVSFPDLQPGDLVFFNTTGNAVSHVGIWVGSNKFVHASCSRGVVVDEMAGYYSRRLVGARRL